MRALVLVLAALAGVKIWTQDQILRSASAEALIQAYRDRAVQACQKDARREPVNEATAVSPQAWGRPASVSLEFGRRGVDVKIWDVDNPLWNVRYKHPHLVLGMGGQRSNLVCEYDVIVGTATISRL